MRDSMPPWFNESGYVILVVCALLAAYELYRAIRIRPHRYDGLFMAIGLLWGVGLGCKVAEIGPVLLRYWVADIGFPLMISWGLWELFRARQYREASRNAESEVRALELFRRKIIGRRNALYFTVVASYAYEIISGYMAKEVNDTLKPGEERMPVGEFDWYDVAAYTVGGLIGLLIIWRWLKFADGFKQAAAAHDAARAMHDQQAAGTQANGAASTRVTAERQRRKSRRGRGGRGRKK